MRTRLVMLWLALTLAGVRAETREVVVATLPPGAAIVELGNSHPVAGPSPGPRRWMADIASPHTYRFTHPNFDAFELTLRWHPQVGRWELLHGSRDGRPAFLQPGQPIAFSKTVRLNLKPGDARAYLVGGDLDLEATAVRRCLEPSASKEVTVNGVGYTVWALARDAEGRVTIPRAHRPPWLLLERPHFETRILRFDEGELDAPGSLFPSEPVVLRSQRGPFGYWQFNLAAGALAALALVVGLPRARRARGERARRVALASLVVRQAEAGDLLGQRLTTEGGAEFWVLRLIGSGATGAVFEAARVCSPEERWAVKMLKADSSGDARSRERFLQEIATCCRLQHPGIVKILDWGLHREQPFLVMELIEGGEVRDALRLGPLPCRQALAWCSQALGALREAHARGIVHRDLKPENLMLTAAGRVKVTDFGVATRPGRRTAVGTPRYMAPEQLEGKAATQACDIYSLGVVLYEMLAGCPPFQEKDPWQLLARKLRGHPPPLSELRSDLPEGLERIVSKMLEPDPERRFPSVEDVLAALQELPPED